MQERHVGEIAGSYIYLAQYELDMLDRKRDALDVKPGVTFDKQPRPTNGKGKSSEGSGVHRDLASALVMFKKVIESNAPDKEVAEEDLRYIRKRQEAVDLNVVMDGQSDDGAT